MFWLTDQDTYGAVYEDEYPNDMPWDERRMEWAMKSREQVMNHDKFKQIFQSYASAIGIDKEQDIPEWKPIMEKRAKQAAEKEAKRIAAEQKKKEEEAKRLEAEKLAAKQAAQKDDKAI